MFLYEFAEKTAQKPDTVATYVRRNKKIFKNHVERRQKQIWLDEKAVDILLKKYPEVQKKQKKPLNKESFEEIIIKSLKTLYENQEILAKEIDEIRALVEELEESFDHKQAEQQKEDNSLISLEKLFGEDTQVDRLTRQVREQGEKMVKKHLFTVQTTCRRHVKRCFYYGEKVFFNCKKVFFKIRKPA